MTATGLGGYASRRHGNGPFGRRFHTLSQLDAYRCENNWGKSPGATLLVDAVVDHVQRGSALFSSGGFVERNAVNDRVCKFARPLRLCAPYPANAANGNFGAGRAFEGGCSQQQPP